MEQIVLDVEQRTKKTKKFREEGFVPGVIYGGKSEKAQSIKIQEVSLKKILSKHGMNAKLGIQFGDEKKSGFIKEIQRQPVTNKIVHVDLQFVSKDQNVKLQIPIVFKGEEGLRANQLQLNVNKQEAEVLGKIDLMPEVIHVDVSQKNAGDTITFKDLNLNEDIKTHDKIDEVYASVTNLVIEKEIEDEADTEEVKAAE
ncbi:50S ribosomal protein L25 [Clostridium pasteurianum]|uniref:Large ribosomal subunit protein bL25 n=1 Tax=Clostridium pasteurianum BC1 TaxID=86416 RepID=R4KFS3_CLOPA|nr:50S ribosomal protein L25 [Clostridium pasteurianum]AGK98460.1 ribosomal protein L25, Ctc-form [Clostridium pasteurianum BC1]